jgi:hypothetical protein
MARAEAVRQAGYFDECFFALEDWEWLIRLAEVGPFKHLPVVTAEYVTKVGENSRNNLTLIQMQALYQLVYLIHSDRVTPEVQAARQKFYASKTGRDLMSDMPDMYKFDIQESGGKKIKALQFVQNKDDEIKEECLSRQGNLCRKTSTEDILAAILESDDLMATLQKHESVLDEKLLTLVQANAATAHQENNTELAEGLDALAEYILDVIAHPVSG